MMRAPVLLTSILLARVADRFATRASQTLKKLLLLLGGLGLLGGRLFLVAAFFSGRTLGGSCCRRAFCWRSTFDDRTFDRFRSRNDSDFRNRRRQHCDHWIVGIENRLHLVGELD